MLSFIPLVLFGSLAAAAFVDDGEETGAQDAHDDGPDGLSDDTAEAQVAAGGENMLDLDFDAPEAVGAPTGAAPLILTHYDMAAAFLESLDDDEDDDDWDDDADEDDVPALTLIEGGAIFASPDAPDLDVIAIEVDDDVLPLDDALPGPEDGFRTVLAPGDELTLNISDDVTGRIAAVQTVHDHNVPGEGSDLLSYSLNFYLVPDDIPLPEGGYEGSEAEFIDLHEAQKLGEVDLGRFATSTNPETGDVEVTEDSRQTEPPNVVSNRDVVVMDALFTG